MQLRTYLEKGDHAIQLWLRIEQNRTEGHGSWWASPFFMRDKSLPRKAGKGDRRRRWKGYERGSTAIPPFHHLWSKTCHRHVFTLPRKRGRLGV